MKGEEINNKVRNIKKVTPSLGVYRGQVNTIFSIYFRISSIMLLFIILFEFFFYFDLYKYKFIDVILDKVLFFIKDKEYFLNNSYRFILNSILFVIFLHCCIGFIKLGFLRKRYEIGNQKKLYIYIVFFLVIILIFLNLIF